jgi:hypothetical protein
MAAEPGTKADGTVEGQTRIRRLDSRRDMVALARLYEREDSDRGFLARCLLKVLMEKPGA